MEVKVFKGPAYIRIDTYVNDGFGRDYCRLNSAMTKDLIKEEMMCRVYSFRPTIFDCRVHILNGKIDRILTIQERLISSAEKNDENITYAEVNPRNWVYDPSAD